MRCAIATPSSPRRARRYAACAGDSPTPSPTARSSEASSKHPRATSRAAPSRRRYATRCCSSPSRSRVSSRRSRTPERKQALDGRAIDEGTPEALAGIDRRRGSAHFPVPSCMAERSRRDGARAPRRRRGRGLLALRALRARQAAGRSAERHAGGRRGAADLGVLRRLDARGGRARHERRRDVPSRRVVPMSAARRRDGAAHPRSARRRSRDEERRAKERRSASTRFPRRATRICSSRRRCAISSIASVTRRSACSRAPPMRRAGCSS